MEDFKALDIQDLESVAGGAELYDVMNPEERAKLSRLFDDYRKAYLDERCGKGSVEERDKKRQIWEEYYDMMCEKYSVEG